MDGFRSKRIFGEHSSHDQKSHGKGKRSPVGRGKGPNVAAQRSRMKTRAKAARVKMPKVSKLRDINFAKVTSARLGIGGVEFKTKGVLGRKTTKLFTGDSKRFMSVWDKEKARR